MKKKVVIIGLDGLEPTIVETLMERGRLPHFAAIRDGGFYSRLKTTYPALTPVAWSSFVTGTNPGGHGIFDFIRRDPVTYQPDLALSRFEQPKNMFVGPTVVNRRQGVPFWHLLTAAGIPSTVLRCPCTFPPDSISGRMLAGVGVPDLRGSQGTGTFYTEDSSVQAQESEHVVRLNPAANFTTHVIGPRKGHGKDALSDIHVTVHPQHRMIALSADGTSIELREGTWSPWIRLKFKFSLLQTTSGLVRFFLRSIKPHVEFYASPVNFDAALPMFPISCPGEYAKELVEKIGLFGTLGMAEDHTGLNNGRFDEQAYLSQCQLTLGERERMTFLELGRFTEGVLFVVFDTPDRVQHMFWRFRDREHPCFEPEKAREWGQVVEDHYTWYDSLLGQVLEHVDDNTLLIVLSDHGFTAFRRAIHVNTWLSENGFLSYAGPRGTDGDGKPFAGVDWSRTSAYAVGMSGIYLNIKGRESQGRIDAGNEAESVRRAIEAGLTGLGDPSTQRVAIRSVLRRENIYSGTHLNDSPDLLLNCMPGFRVSWQTALGARRNEVFEDNTKSWSGDHIVDPESVPGILFMNRSVARSDVSILDLAPTILAYLGLQKHEAMEGHSLVEQDRK